MSTVSVTLGRSNGRLYEDVKDDRVSGSVGSGDWALIDGLDALEDLSALVGATVSTGVVEISEIVMCAKCVGECKVF